jgi:hypothetical protein
LGTVIPVPIQSNILVPPSGFFSRYAYQQIISAYWHICRWIVCFDL